MEDLKTVIDHDIVDIGLQKITPTKKVIFL